MKLEIPRPQIPPPAWQRQIGLDWENPYSNGDRFCRDDGVWHGMPLGGLGAGCIGRSPRGDFNLWHLDAGELIFCTLPACQFSIYERAEGETPQVFALSTQPPEEGSLSRWNWFPHNGGTYRALYPRSWWQYEGIFQSEILCEQFSPIWPDCYQESSYPTGIFEWTIHNPTDRPIVLSIMLTWQNTIGWFANANGRSPGDLTKTNLAAKEYRPKWRESTGNFNQWIQDHHRVGCLFNRIRPYAELQEGEGQMAIASIINPAIEAFYVMRWNPEGDGGEVWDYFAMDGSLPDLQNETPASPGEQIAAAMTLRFTVRPGRTRKIPFILAWDFPVMEFAPNVAYFRRHSDFFARTGNNAWTVVRTALKHGDVWKEKIETWQKPLLDRADLSDRLKMALLNELYLFADGGTLWTAATEDDPLGQFALWESLDSCCYENLEARLFGSFATLTLFPRLDKAVLEAFSRRIVDEAEKIANCELRIANCKVPLDLGESHARPWEKSENFGDRETVCAFILQVYRDYFLTGETDLEFLWECWQGVATSLALGKEMEQKGAYWWIVALEAAIAIADLLLDSPPANPNLQPPDYPDEMANWQTRCRDWLKEARSLAKDPQENPKEAIGAQFYGQLLGLPEICDRNDIKLRLQEISENCLQTEQFETKFKEIDTGWYFTLAAYLVLMGMKEKGLQIAEIAVKEIYERGLQFRTPAALFQDGTFRNSHALQGTAIWLLYVVLAKNS